jgi:peptide/nickel transport system ATP-binding protein
VSDLLLDVQGLCVRAAMPGSQVESVDIVKDASFQLRRGEVCGLLGATGSGKTVMVRTLLGISSARPGRVAGDAWFQPQGSESRISVFGAGAGGPRAGWAGYVFQDPVAALDPLRRVIEQVADSVAVRHPGCAVAERRERAISWLDQVNLPEPQRLAQMYPFELSGGMAQRVCAAVALATEPELLVADEPTSGLDWSLRREMVELLGAQCLQRGMTLLLISHDIQVVQHLAEQVLVMEGGEIIEQGPYHLVFPPPASHSYTGELEVWAETLGDDSAMRPREVVEPSPRGRLLLRARGLSHSFPGPTRDADPVAAVKAVDLDIHAGEFVALVGESGSGKTTLGKLLLWVLEPQIGTVSFDGQDLGALDAESLRALRSRMQFSYQQPSGALNPRMSVVQHWAETIALHRPGDLPRSEQLIEETLSLFKLEGKGAARPGQLSGGERRRVSVARSMLPEATLLVLDEPTSGLDAAVKGLVVDILRNSHGEDSACLLISHELDLVQRVTDRILVMYGGRIVEDMPADLLGSEAGTTQLHPYTEQLLAASFRAVRRIEAPSRPETAAGGCVFRSRCHRVEEATDQWRQCTSSEPALVPLGSDGHRIACHLTEPASVTEPL